MLSFTDACCGFCSPGVRQFEVSSSTDAVTAAAASGNVWLERRAFYNSALPRNSEEEEKMMQAALELSKLEYREKSLCQDSSLVLSLLCR